MQRKQAVLYGPAGYALAHANALRVAHEDREQDTTAIDHERELRHLHRVARDAPAAGVAHWLLTMQRIRPVPLDHELEPVGDALASTEAILAHWTDNETHGVGIATGKHPERPWTYLAVRVGTFAAWNEWLRDAAAVKEQVPDYGGWADMGGTAEVGPPVERVRHRDPGAFARLAWAPPPLTSFARYNMDAAGGGLGQAMEAQKDATRGGWIWLAVDDPNGTVTVRRNHDLAPGLQVLASGTVIPWEQTRSADGWRLALQAPMHSQYGLTPSNGSPAAPWLTDKLTKQRK